METIPYIFFFQAEDGIRDKLVTGVQTCALPIFEIAHEKSCVQNAVGDSRRRNELALVLARPAVGKILDNFEFVSIGILNCEVVVSGLPFRYCCRHFDSMRSKIIAHLLRVIGIDGYVIELTVLFCRICEQLNVLLIVNFDERNANGAIIALERERLLKAQEVLIKNARFRQITCVKRDVSHTKNSRTLRFRLSEK